MNTLQANQAKKKPQPKIQNEFETDNSFKAIPKGIAQEVSKASQDAVKDMWHSILGTGKYEQTHGAQPKMGGDLTPGQAVDLKHAQEQKAQAPRNEAPINYFREIAEAGKHTSAQEAHQIRQEVQAIIYELKRLASSSKAIQKEVSMAVGPAAAPANVGIYHKNFFEWMLIVVRDARKRVEDAGAWLRTVKSKKKQAIGGMKKNMSQLMSGERSSSNSTG